MSGVSGGTVLWLLRRVHASAGTGDWTKRFDLCCLRQAPCSAFLQIVVFAVLQVMGQRLQLRLGLGDES